MQINRPLAFALQPVLFSFVASALLSACSVAPPAPVKPAPPPPPQAAKPAAPLLPANPVDWRDAPLTAGDWSYRREGTSTSAVFSGAQGSRLFALSCHRERGSVTLTRAGAAPGSVPATIVTTYAARPFSITPLAADGMTLAISLRAADPVLDEIAFSRGRIAFEVNGLPTLYLPVHAEVGRVIEDCR